MFKEAHFVKSVFKLEDIPKDNLLEIILCGRSNVGKSSFINSLLNRKNLAKTSSTPGKTRSINYYLVDNEFYIVDLPGFGYAKTSKKERESWAKLIEEFFQKSANIALVLHMLDSRHSPADSDLMLNKYITDLKIPYIAVLTKADKLNQSELHLARENVKRKIKGLILKNNLFFYSSVKQSGKKDIIKILSNYIQK